MLELAVTFDGMVHEVSQIVLQQSEALEHITRSCQLVLSKPISLSSRVRTIPPSHFKKYLLCKSIRNWIEQEALISDLLFPRKSAKLTQTYIFDT